MTLTALGYILAIAAAGLGWWRWRREVRERRLATLDQARRGLTLHEFVRQMAAEGIDGVVATTIYLTIRNRARLDAHKLHPNDALEAYFDDRSDIAELARELMLLLDRALPSSDPEDVARGWRTVGDVAQHFCGGVRPFLRTVQ